MHLDPSSLLNLDHSPVIFQENGFLHSPAISYEKGINRLSESVTFATVRKCPTASVDRLLQARFYLAFQYFHH